MESCIYPFFFYDFFLRYGFISWPWVLILPGMELQLYAWLSWKIFSLPLTVLVHLFICLTHGEFSTYTGSCGQYAKLKGATSPLTPWGWDKAWHGCMWYIKFLIGIYNLKDKVTHLYWFFQDNVELQQKPTYYTRQHLSDNAECHS